MSLDECHCANITHLATLGWRGRQVRRTFICLRSGPVDLSSAKKSQLGSARLVGRGRSARLGSPSKMFSSARLGSCSSLVGALTTLSSVDNCLGMVSGTNRNLIDHQISITSIRVEHGPDRTEKDRTGPRSGPVRSSKFASTVRSVRPSKKNGPVRSGPEKWTVRSGENLTSVFFGPEKFWQRSFSVFSKGPVRFFSQKNVNSLVIYAQMTVNNWQKTTRIAGCLCSSIVHNSSNKRSIS